MSKKASNKRPSESLSAQVWKRLRRNVIGMVGLCVIGFSILIAVLGYLIMPDSTPLANDQKPELTIKKPGFSVDMLLIRKDVDPGGNIFNKMLFGEKSAFRTIPIYSWHFEDDHIVVEEYTGNEVNNGDIKKISLAQVVHPISFRNPEIRREDNVLHFVDILGNKRTADIGELKAIVEEDHIVNRTFWLGTDRSGRDLLSRLMAGTRVSLSVGFISVLISLVIGITVGAIGGYFRGKVDEVALWLINVVWSIPTLLLVIAITLALGKGFWQVFVAVGMTMWVEVARIVRGQVLSLREKEFVEAGRALGFTHFRLVLKHILPNVMGPVIVISAANFAAAILIEAGLSFLGVGAQPPTPSWGSMIKDHYGYIIVDAAYLAILPGMAIMIMVLAFNLVGNALRDALDTKSVDNHPLSGA